MTTYKGQCWCGKITFECAGEPLFTQYCHCNKCRSIANLSHLEKDKIGYAFTAGYLTKNFKITSNSKLEELIRNNAKLFLCADCKSFIYGISMDSAKQAGLGVNANNFLLDATVPDSFKPVRHVWYVDRIADINDDLPKFKDAPKEQFGSGERFA